MSRVLVGHSYFLRFDPKLWQAMQPYPPLGTLYAAALLRQAGHEVSFYDAMLETSTKGWGEMLDASSPDVAILFEDNFNYLSKMCLLNMHEAAFEMIGAAKSRGCRVIVCGADVTDNGEAYLDQGADFAAIGEADETVLELVQALDSNNADSASIAGVVYRTSSGETSSTGRRPVMRELDSLPEPARDLIDLNRYRAAWQRHGRFSMNLVSSRGCSFHCNWCAKPIWGQRYNVRSPASVAAEIETLRELGADHIWFMDDYLGYQTRVVGSTFRSDREARYAGSVQVSEPSRPPPATWGDRCPRGGWLRDGLDRRRVRLAEGPRCDGEGDNGCSDAGSGERA